MSQPTALGVSRHARTFSFLLAVTLCGSGLVCASLYSQSAKPEGSAKPKEVALQVIDVNTLEQAQRVLERLKAGYDFASLAKEKSIDPTADRGGYHSTPTKGSSFIPCTRRLSTGKEGRLPISKATSSLLSSSATWSKF